MRRSRGRPTANETKIINALLLDAARELFTQNGISNSSMEELAEHLGVSKHTIYRRYAHKTALLEAVVERDIRRFREALTLAGANTTNQLSRLRRIALRYVEFGSSQDYAAFYLLVCAEAVISPELRIQLEKWSQMSLEPLYDAVLSAQSAGFLKKGQSSAKCELLVDLLEGVNNRTRLGNQESKSAARKLFQQRWLVFLSAVSVVPPDRKPPRRLR